MYNIKERKHFKRIFHNVFFYIYHEWQLPLNVLCFQKPQIHQNLSHAELCPSSMALSFYPKNTSLPFAVSNELTSPGPSVLHFTH